MAPFLSNLTNFHSSAISRSHSHSNTCGLLGGGNTPTSPEVALMGGAKCSSGSTAARLVGDGGDSRMTTLQPFLSEMNRWKQMLFPFLWPAAHYLCPLWKGVWVVDTVSFTALFNVATTVGAWRRRRGGGGAASFYLLLLSLQLITAKFIWFQHDLLLINYSEFTRKYPICCARSLQFAHVRYKFVKRMRLRFGKCLQLWQAEMRYYPGVPLPGQVKWSSSIVSAQWQYSARILQLLTHSATVDAFCNCWRCECDRLGEDDNYGEKKPACAVLFGPAAAARMQINPICQ